MNYIASLGASKSKLLVGIPFYGQTYRLVRNDFYNLGDAAAGAGASGEFTKQPGMLAYYEICDRIKRQNWKVADGTKKCFFPRRFLFSFEKKLFLNQFFMNCLLFNFVTTRTCCPSQRSASRVRRPQECRSERTMDHRQRFWRSYSLDRRSRRFHQPLLLGGFCIAQESQLWTW